MKKQINMKVISIIAVCVLFFVFTFADLSIAKLVYNPDSFFGRFFEIVGTLPMPIVGVFSCIALIGTTEWKLHVKNILSYLIGGLLLLYFSFYGVLCIQHALPVTLIPMILVTIVWIACSIWLTWKIIHNGKRDSLRKAAIVGVGCCFVAVIGVSIIKNIMSRPRFYTLTDADAQFTYWFEKQAYTANSGFPSGHSAQSALTFCSLLVPTFCEMKNEKLYKKIALICSSVFTICVMFSRMVLGMHYATDVMVGAGLTVITLLLLRREKREEKVVQTEVRVEQ